MRAPLKAGLMALAILAFPVAAHADVVGFEAGGAYWKQKPSGYFQDASSGLDTQADVEDDLGLDSDSAGFVWAAIEHPLPVLPNLKLRYTPVDMSGSGTVTTEVFEFRGIRFSSNEPVHSTLQLDQTDVILYYEVLDNWVNLDLGLNVKVIDGQVHVVSQDDPSQNTELAFSAPAPMLYGRLVGDLPFTGLSAGVEGSAIAYSGNSFFDAQAFVRYEYIAVGVEAGYRRMQLELDDVDDVTADITIDGPYLGVYADF